MSANARLLVEIAASTAQFREDLGRATAVAEREARKIEQAFEKARVQTANFGAGLRSALGALGVAFGTAEIVGWAKETVAAASALNDFADQTGSSVEELSRLSNQARISGTDFATLQGLVLKLTAGMAGADEEGSNVGRALKALSIETRDPAKALQEIALALDKYQDGIGKAAIARDLFGKGGPAFLAALKDIARLQDVAATTSTEQAAEAEKLEQAFRRLSYESTEFKKALLNDVVPALTEMIGEFREGIRIAGGFWEALKTFGAINPMQGVAENLREVDQRIAALEKGRGRLEAITAAAKGAKSELDILRQQREFLRFQQRQEIQRNVDKLGFTGDARDLKLAQKDVLAYTGAKDKETRATKDARSEAERYLETLQRQLERTQDLTAVETALAEIRRRPELAVAQDRILDVAREIDLQNALKKSLEEQQRVRQEEARAREVTSKLAQRGMESALAERDALAQQNQQIRDETELIGKDLASIREIYQARLDAAIATKEQALASLQNVEGMETEASILEDQIRLLRERKGLFSERGMAEDFAEQMQRAKQINDLFVNSFADGVTDVVMGTKSLSDAFRDMERQIVGSITRMAAHNVGEALFGASSSSGGGGIFAALGPYLANLLGGGFAGSEGWLAGAGAFASGGSPPVGHVALVGERGPELFVPHTSGTIIPNDVLIAKRGARTTNNVSININVPGSVSRATADQIAVRAGAEVRRALARNT
jgi:hypothetical protein